MYLDVTYRLLLLNALNKKVFSKSNLLFSFCLYTFFLSIEIISWDDSSRLLYDVSDMIFIAPCLAVWYFIPIKTTMRQYPTKLNPNTPIHDTMY